MNGQCFSQSGIWTLGFKNTAKIQRRKFYTRIVPVALYPMCIVFEHLGSLMRLAKQSRSS